MSFDMKRFKNWDWAYLGAFVVAIVGISIPWWHFKVADVLGGLGGLLTGADVPGVSANLSGWSEGVVGTGKATFALMLIVLVLVVVPKALFKQGSPLPNWYKESWAMMGIGGLLTILGIVGVLKAPYGGFDVWGWRPGSLITLVAAVAMAGIGYLMFVDKSGDYDGAGKFQVPEGLNKMVQGDQGSQGGGAPTGGAPGGGEMNQATAAPAAKFCVDCGAPLQSDAAACENCGKAV